MSIYASIDGIDEDEPVGAPWLYQGSHILPAEDDPRGGEIGLALIPSHITRDGRDDQPADGTPWPWLRLNVDVPGEDPTVLLNPAQARYLADRLNKWADRAVGPLVPTIGSHTYEGDGGPCTTTVYGMTCRGQKLAHELINDDPDDEEQP